MKKIKIDITTLTILKIIGILIALWIAWKIFDIILIVFVAIIIAATLSPTVDWLSSKKLPRIISVILIYILALLIIGGTGYLIVPPLIFQFKELALDFPGILIRITPSFNFVKDFYHEHVLQKPLEVFSGQLTQLTANIFTTAQGFFSALGAIISTLFLIFYLLLEKNSVKEFINSVAPENQKERIFIILRELKIKWGAWLRGRLLLSLIVGIITFIGLLVLNVPFALALAILAAILDIIPYIGPVIAAIPAILITFFISPWLGLAVLIFYIVIQQLENLILVPKIMQKTVGLSPITIIIALLVGAKFVGILGAVLAIPAAAALVVLFNQWKKTSDGRQKTS